MTKDRHRHHLLNLLARIHGDGGHYVEQHGLEKAVADAEAKWVVWKRHGIEALRAMARQPCRPDNCGTVCLCNSCHARKALETLDPGWTP